MEELGKIYLEEYKYKSQIQGIQSSVLTLRGIKRAYTSYIEKKRVVQEAKSVGNAAKGAGNTKLYRVMSDAEYNSMMNNGGKFMQPPVGPIMEEKWFATSSQDAAQWGSEFYPDGNYRMVQVEVPSNLLNQMYYNSRLDGIGPAYSGGIDWLNSFMQGVTTVK